MHHAAGKGAAAAPESPKDSDDGPLRPAGAAAGQLVDHLAGPAAAADDEDQLMPEFGHDNSAADDLPPTPADGLVSHGFEGDGAADGGYTGGTAAAGHTPGTLGKLLPPTPDFDLAAACEMDVDAAAGLGAQEHDNAAQELPVDGLDNETTQQEQQAAAAEGATPTKTFQRRKGSQQQQGQEQQQEAAESSAAAAAKAARQRHTAALLGHRKRVIIDDYPSEGGAGGGGASRRAAAAAAARLQPPTELPAAEIRALLADRSLLMDKQVNCDMACGHSIMMWSCGFEQSFMLLVNRHWAV